MSTTDPRDTERDAIVAWLLAEADRHEAMGNAYVSDGPAWPASIRHWQSTHALRQAAGRLVLDEHRRTP